VHQRALSPQTVASYRDAFTLLLRFAEQRLGKPPTTLRLADIDRGLLSGFLDHLERDRKNSVRTRNARLAAVRSFLKFAARRDVASLHVVEQALAVPMKRFDRPMIGFLTREQMLAVMDVPKTTWVGHRDRLLFTLLYNTGARVSEIVGVRVADVVLGPAPCVRLFGKGRKQRSVPLWTATAKAVRAWLQRNGQPGPDWPVLPTREGNPMTRANVAQRLRRAVHAATARHPELAKRSISPHTIRHTTAMHLLQSGVDVHVIALWLGHENPSTTHMYIELDLTMKERALSRLTPPPNEKAARYQPPDALLSFLQLL
ncbi:MAG: site-specific integrase, partial [Planctomycetes bacterium]|nr:site-specific integrase [Planctomycetota bacterium]